MDTFRPFHAAPFCVVLLILLTGCVDSTGDQAGIAPADTIHLESRADSAAMKAYDALGGPNAWASVPYLRFDFASGDETSRTVHASHLWDRTTGDYRVEMQAGEDSTYVALFNVNTRDGDVYLDGQAVDESTEQEMLERAYRRFINDSYWLLMPVKMMDPGVTRTYLPDSSTAEMDVLRLSFDDVGLTPGDQYWVYIDNNTGRVDKWAFHLQNHPPDHVPTPIQWRGYKSIETPTGSIEVSERKIRNGSITYTDNVDVPESPPEGAFSDPNPILQGS